MIPIVFDSLLFAEEFIVKDRLTSLENDVNRCLPTTKEAVAGYVPFPALLYCFSIIDLLGSIYAAAMAAFVFFVVVHCYMRYMHAGAWTT
jgi:hypothetical protein